MAIRYLETGFFKSPFVRGLQAPLKLLYAYIISDATGAGIWTLDLEICNLILGTKITKDEFLKHFHKTGKAIPVTPLQSGKFFFPDFIEHQYPRGLQATNPAHANFIRELYTLGFINDECEVIVGEKAKNRPQNLNIKPTSKSKKLSKSKKGALKGLLSPLSNSNSNSKSNSKGNSKGNTSLFVTFSLKDRQHNFKTEILKHREEYPPELLEAFYNHYSAEDKNGVMRFEADKYFNISKKLKNWQLNEKPKTNNSNNSKQKGGSRTAEKLHRIFNRS